jgi:DNA-binding transcriptional ArsR family regulator
MNVPSLTSDTQTDSDASLSATFAALADPTRRAMLARLAVGEATVNELAEPFDISLQAVSKHLKVLERARLISRGRHAQHRPCRLEAAPLETAAQWLERNRQLWVERYDQLEAHLRTLQGPPTPSTAPAPPKPPKEPKEHRP